MMARYIIENRIDSVAKLTDFDVAVIILLSKSHPQQSWSLSEKSNKGF